MTDSVDIRDAVIITNDNDSHLKDISNGRPACLLPLVNVEAIHYLMIQLLHGNIRNFTIFCGKHKTLIKEFFKKVCYNDHVSGLVFNFIDDENIETVGDAIRYLDNKEFDKEFVLVHGDLITNCDFKKLIKVYQDSRKKNPSIISSKVISKKRDFTKTCDGFYYDKTTNVITTNGTSLKNYSDPQIYICSKQLGLRFHDNEDCYTMDDIVSQVLATSEVVTDVIHVIIPKDDFCIRVQTINSYFEASTRIIRSSIYRCSPKSIFNRNIKTVPSSDHIISTHQSSYISSYLPKNFMHGSSRFIGNVEVMQGSSIGKNSRLIDSIIGANCMIGNNVILKNCVLLDGTKIDNNCLISDTFVSRGVHIKEFCQITDKCIIENDFVVPRQSKIRRQRLSKKNILNIWDIDIIPDNSHDVAHPVNDIDEDFETELHDLIKEALDEKMSLMNLKLDVGKLQMGYEKNGEDMCMDLCIVFVKYPLKVPSEKKYGLRVLELFGQYGELIGSFVGKDVNLRRICLEVVEECACQDEFLLMKVSDIVFSMYECGLVNKADIDTWYKESLLLEDDEMSEQARKVRENLTGLMEHLEDTEDESNEDSDEESDDSDD